MKTATLKMLVYSTVAAASVAVAVTTLGADSLTCDLSQYKSGAGPSASVDQGVLTVSWPGQSGSEMRTRYAIDGGQPIVRDLSVLVDSALPAAAVRGTIRSSAPSTLVDVIEFDRYRGKGVPEGRVSLSLRLTFRSPDRTLTDAEVDQAENAVVAALGRAHDATRR